MLFIDKTNSVSTFLLITQTRNGMTIVGNINYKYILKLGLV